MIPTPLELYQAQIQADWIDYNGHLNDGYYAVAFGFAVEKVLAYLDLHNDYRLRSHCTIYTAEAHICYLRELKEADDIHVTCQLLASDAKRIQLFQMMFHSQEGYLAATHEAMFLHVDQTVLKTVPMPVATQVRLQRIVTAHQALPLPERSGRAIKMT